MKFFEKILKKKESPWESIETGIPTDLNSLFFIDSNFGYLVGKKGSIYSTEDGGISWRDRKHHSVWQNLSCVFFITKDKGWITGKQGCIFSTADSGENWLFQAGAKDIDINAIFFTDEKTGFALGQNGSIFTTQDSGFSWNLLSISERQITVPLRAVHFPTQKIGYIAGDRSTLLKTEDSGKTWNTITIPIEDSLKDIQFLNSDIGFVLGERTIYSTLDAGKTWNFYKDPFYEDSLSGISMIDESHAWAVGGNTKEESIILSTKDGGKTWEKEVLKFGRLNGVQFLDSNTGFAIGNNGTLLRYFPKQIT